MWIQQTYILTDVTLALPTPPHKSQKDLLEQDLLRTIFSLKPFHQAITREPLRAPGNSAHTTFQLGAGW